MAKEKRRIIADESEISKKVKLKEEICAKAAERKRRSRKKQEETQSRECYHQLSPDSFLPQQEKNKIIQKFETQLEKVDLFMCQKCRGVGMDKLSRKNLCKYCAKYPNEDPIKNNLLPIWKKSNSVHFEIPDELLCLTEVEKLLIQQLSPLVPLHHIKNGTMGLQGHCCAFPVQLQQLATVLPLLPSSVRIIKMVHSIRTELGSQTSKLFYG